MKPRRASGRPLRFFGVILLCWIAARVGIHITPIPLVSAEPVMVTAPQTQVAREQPGRSLKLARFMTPLAPLSVQDHAHAVSFADVSPLKIGHPPIPYPKKQHHDAQSATPVPTALPFPVRPSTSLAGNRWQLSAWALWRLDGAAGNAAASVGQLGGSQAGARLDLDLNPGALFRLSAYARMTAALNHPAAPEAAIGIAYQPSRRLPVSLALERRIALGEGARDAMAVMAVGGFGPTPVIAGFSAQAYGQTGIVGFHANDRFVDGKFALTTPVTRLPLRVGASLSGGAQPGVHRVDVGPEVQVPFPLPSAPARLSVEWRQRVAGHARPASGLAITLAGDF